MKSKEVPYSIISELKLRLLNTKKLKNFEGNEIPVIVSLTSIPFRLNRLHLVVKSLLIQTNKPKKIILWLDSSLENKIPNNLKRLFGDIFTIEFTTLNSSHVKLVPTLEKYPNEIIVTCDDDLMYDKDWLKGLYEEHLKSPKDIIAYTLRQIQYDDNNNILPYNQWKLRDLSKPSTFLALGYNGILYPPNSLPKETLNSELYMKLAPKADDLWFKAMAILNKTNIKKVSITPKQNIPIMATQKVSLKKQNVGKLKNNQQWDALVEHFNIKL
ncbi:glycosyltransferase [Flavobacterium sp.]|uniref:glycosyltransferase n=1 Tax=Flavobacterium sp. TaxID=239 RepID=UPI00260A19CF|nr:glycosyltransferase [Flavobacterium sp.]